MSWDEDAMIYLNRVVAEAKKNPQKLYIVSRYSNGGWVDWFTQELSGSYAPTDKRAFDTIFVAVFEPIRS